MEQTARRIAECRVLSIALTGDEYGNEVSVAWDAESHRFQRIISWEAFQQTAVTGAIMFGHDEDRIQARFTSDSHEEIKAVVAQARRALEGHPSHPKVFTMTWVY